MASYKTYEGLPDLPADKSMSLYDVFKRGLDKGHYFNVPQLWNSLCHYSSFTEEEYRTTILPIAVMILDFIEHRMVGHYFHSISPSFQQQLVRTLRKYFPAIRGRKRPE